MIYNEQYWNDKWQKDNIIYEGRNLYSTNEKQSCDVRIFLTKNEAILGHILDQYNLIHKTFNDTQLQIQQFIVKNIKYKSDDTNNKSPEFWQFPFETLQSGLADCEDGAILIQSLLLHQGVPSYRVKVQQGFAKPAPTQPQGGHGYCLFLEDEYNNNQDWKILDWCFYQDEQVPVIKKPNAKNGGQRNAYGEIWFTFNNEYSWSHKSLAISGRVNSEKVIMKEIDNKQIFYESILSRRKYMLKNDQIPNLIR